MSERRVTGLIGVLGSLLVLGFGAFHPKGFVSENDDAYFSTLAEAAGTSGWRGLHMAILAGTTLVACALVLLARRTDSPWSPVAQLTTAVGAAVAIAALGIEVGAGAAVQRGLEPAGFGFGFGQGGAFGVPSSLLAEQALFGIGVLLFYGVAFVLAGVMRRASRPSGLIAVVGGLTGVGTGTFVLYQGRVTNGTWLLFNAAATLNLAWLIWTSVREWKAEA